MVVSVDATPLQCKECQALTYILEAHQWQVTFILGTSHSGINLVAVFGCVLLERHCWQGFGLGAHLVGAAVAD